MALDWTIWSAYIVAGLIVIGSILYILFNKAEMEDIQPEEDQ